MPDGVPAAYQQAIEEGWKEGLLLVQKISANARYFTDGAGKVPIDVSNGDAAAGLAIDFYGRYQAESTRVSQGNPHMQYITPVGGSGVSADPISLLRGAPHRELAIRFMRFVLSVDGQRLWTYRAGTPGGPVKYTLRRLPIRRDFYPSPEHPDQHALHRQHLRYSGDALDDPAINPYSLATRFTYHPRWTARHFNIHRDLIRAMGIDSADELKAAWKAINAHPDATRRAHALAIMESLPTVPETLDWRSARSITRRHDRLDYMREWTHFFRQHYQAARDVLTEETL
jgi:ABC-type glycerol-3-phosphate transport system substrate-binding protein